MKFKEFDTVKIVRDCEEGLQKGEIGAVLMVFEKPREAYEVEVLDEDGNLKIQCTLLPEDLELVET
ncbi:MAG: DUF4926 domain-containing protein [Lachnospiraceae bacterium]|nr:DUF4926 domain-containing protein [Lachnospiraceae bacterium]MDE6980893.1 DUF4926 domain-containing protein [Lachnospiraceae bacterium]